MSEFWGYPYADIAAIIIISGLSAICLLCAKLFLNGN